MTLGEALFIARDIVEEVAGNVSDNRISEAVGVLQYAIENNLEELIEEAVTLLSQVPKEMNQELAIALTQIVEGGE